MKNGVSPGIRKSAPAGTAGARHGRRGQPDLRPGRGDAEPAEQHVAQAAGRRGQRRRARPRDQEAAAIRPGAIPWSAIVRPRHLPSASSAACRGLPAAGSCAPAATRVTAATATPARVGTTSSRRAPGRLTAAADAQPGEHREPGQPVADPADRQHADQRGEPGQQDQDAGDQRLLVVRPEVRDREVLDRDRRQVDRRLADRDDRRAVRADERGRQLGYAQRHGAARPASPRRDQAR